MRTLASSAILSVLFIAAASGDVSAQKRSKKEEPAKPGPDLMVIDALTTLKAGGCKLEDPLFTGTVAIKNRGTERAPTLATAPLTAAWIPENLDIKDEDIDPNSLTLDEVTSKQFDPGKGQEKTGRNFTKSRKVYIMVDPYDKIKESNEKNNLLVRNLPITCP